MVPRRGGDHAAMAEINRAFLGRLIPVRYEDRKKLALPVPGVIMESCRQKPERIIQDQSECAAKLRMWTQRDGFESLADAEDHPRLYANDPTKVAPRAKVQVYHTDFKGKLVVSLPYCASNFRKD